MFFSLPLSNSIFLVQRFATKIWWAHFNGDCHTQHTHTHDTHARMPACLPAWISNTQSIQFIHSFIQLFLFLFVQKVRSTPPSHSKDIINGDDYKRVRVKISLTDIVSTLIFHSYFVSKTPFPPIHSLSPI